MLVNSLKQGFGLAVGYVLGLTALKFVSKTVLKSTETLEKKN